MSKKTLTIVLSGSPYGGERAAQALRLAAAALDRGHDVNLFASADGTYAAVSGQAAKGLPNIGKELNELIARGLRVELCGSCLRFRGLSADRLTEGAQPSTLRGLGAMLREADAVVNLQVASLAVLIRSAPYGTLEAAEGVRHLAGREALGFEHVVGLFCDEGVWALAKGQHAAPGFTSLEPALEKLASEGVPLLAERESLSERSLGREDLLPGVQLVEPIRRQLFDADVVLVF